jgi:hypothetical protein
VAGAADALHGYGDGAGAADLADEVDVADVDAEFQRGGGDEDFDLAVFEALLGVEAQGAGERAVVRGDVLGPRRFWPSSKAIFSTSLRVLTKTSVERWLVAWAASLSKISSTCRWK